MNDLTVMFPMATTAAELDAYLAPTTIGADGGALVPPAVYTADSGAIPLSDLRAVGFRLDPCFGQLGPITDPSTCDNQIRLIFQPLFGGAADTPPEAEDAGVHVLYSITRDQLLAAVKEIAAARAAVDDSDLGPLGVHPIMAREGMGGEMAQKLTAIAAKYAAGTKIERITTFELEALDAGGGGSGIMNGSGSGGPIVTSDLFWEMHGFDVKNGVETAIEVPTLPPATTNDSLNAATNPLEAQPSPATSSADNFALLASASMAMAAAPAARQAAFDAALRVENPMKNTADSIDCVSCHIAEQARELVGEQMLGMSSTGNSNAFVPDPSIPAADLAQTTTSLFNPSDNGLDIHAFSYLGTVPLINQRVINETAANLAYLQTLVAGH